MAKKELNTEAGVQQVRECERKTKRADSTVLLGGAVVSARVLVAAHWCGSVFHHHTKRKEKPMDV